MAQALYLKWRPTGFEDVFGQEHVITTLRNALALGRTSHAYLFAGPRGTGKTTSARLLAKALNCTFADASQRPCNTCPQCVAVNEGRFIDLIEIDAASNTSVEDVRDLREKINFAPNEGQYKVYIIDEVHMLSNAAFNALLKTLEEPPPHAVFVLATTEAHKLPTTVTSRCQRYTFRRIPLVDIVERLRIIVDSEGFNVEPAVLEMVARHATGSLRDGISLLDQLIVSPTEAVTVARAQSVLGTSNDKAVRLIIEAVAKQDTAQGLEHINQALDTGTDPRQFARQITDWFRGMLLIQLGGTDQLEVTEEVRSQMQQLTAQFDARQLLQAVRKFDEAARDRRGGWLRQLPLELAFLNSVGYEAAAPGVVVTPAAMAQQAAKPTVTAQPQPTPSKPVATTPAEQAAPAAVPKPSSNTRLSYSVVMEKWPQVVGLSRTKHHALPALLEWGRPLSVEGNKITIAFQKSFAKDKVDTPEMGRFLQASANEIFGEAVELRYVVKADLSEQSQLPDIKDDGAVAMGVKLGGKPKQRS